MEKNMNDRFENINIESFDYPILVADESLFIIGKNSAAGEYNIRFRVGASLKNYLSAYDFKRIEELKKHDTLFITSINNLISKPFLSKSCLVYSKLDKAFNVFAISCELPCFKTILISTISSLISK